MWKLNRKRNIINRSLSESIFVFWLHDKTKQKMHVSHVQYVNLTVMDYRLLWDCESDTEESLLFTYA